MERLTGHPYYETDRMLNTSKQTDRGRAIRQAETDNNRDLATAIKAMGTAEETMKEDATYLHNLLADRLVTNPFTPTAAKITEVYWTRKPYNHQKQAIKSDAHSVNGCARE